jgi:hypothetical protein
MPNGSLPHPEPFCDLIGPHPLVAQGDDRLVALLSVLLASQVYLLDSPCSDRTAHFDVSRLLFCWNYRMSSTADLGECLRQDHRDTACKVRGSSAIGRSPAWRKVPLS